MKRSVEEDLKIIGVILSFAIIALALSRSDVFDSGQLGLNDARGRLTGNVDLPPLWAGTIEICGNNIDDDGNGGIDESPPCICAPGDTQVVSCGYGACTVTIMQSCVKSEWKPECSPNSPGFEICNNTIDDDCDNITDEDNCTCHVVCEFPLCGQGNGCGGLCGNSSIGDYSDECDTADSCGFTRTVPSNCTSQNQNNPPGNSTNSTTNSSASNTTRCSACVCYERLECDPYGECIDGRKSRSCTTRTNCDIEYDVDNCTLEGKSEKCIDSTNLTARIIYTECNSTCNESWSCTKWDACGLDGLRRRVCFDANVCGTSTQKPAEIESCTYTGSCSDGVLNGDETDIDCGGLCPACQNKEPPKPSLSITAEPIAGSILSDYELSVIITNNGEAEAAGLKIALDTGTSETKMIDSLSPGESRNIIFNLKLPKDSSKEYLQVQVSKDDAIIYSYDTPLMLKTPALQFEISKDLDGRAYYTIVIDNREGQIQDAQLEVAVFKDRQNYYFDVINLENIPSGEIFDKEDYLNLKLPPGEYDVRAKLYTSGSRGSVESAQLLRWEGDRKVFNLNYLFYIIMALIVAGFGYVLYTVIKNRR